MTSQAIGKPVDAKVVAAEQRTVADIVGKRLREYQVAQQIHLPADYSAENAIKQAWYKLQETVDKNNRAALEVCTPVSIAQAMLRMVLQGLNPDKLQCYFIVHGSRLTCMRSYMGSIAVARRITKCEEPLVEIVYEGDEFEYEIGPRQKWVKTHRQKLQNVDGKKIKAAYCTFFWNQVGDQPARPDFTEIMTFEQIQASWKHSLTYKPNDPSCPHNLHPEEFCRRTVISRAAKRLINSSSDSHLFLEAFNAEDEAVDEQAAQETIEETMAGLVELPAGAAVETPGAPAAQPLESLRPGEPARLVPDDSAPAETKPGTAPPKNQKRQPPFLQ